MVCRRRLGGGRMLRRARVRASGWGREITLKPFAVVHCDVHVSIKAKRRVARMRRAVVALMPSAWLRARRADT